jgi:hypothetical protein
MASHKEIERAQICHVVFDFLPLIDEHNKQRQAILKLEKIWHTRDAWFRLLCTLTGMSLVDMHHCYRYHLISQKGMNPELVDNFGVKTFSTIVCGGIRIWPRFRERVIASVAREDCILARITDENGHTNRPPTEAQKSAGKRVGNAYTRNCFICRRYLGEDGQPIYRTTQNWCRKCNMPLCNTSRVGEDGGRKQSCLEEHTKSSDDCFGCVNQHKKDKQVPKDQLISLHPAALRRNPVRRRSN